MVKQSYLTTCGDLRPEMEEVEPEWWSKWHQKIQVDAHLSMRSRKLLEEELDETSSGNGEHDPSD